MDVHSELAHTGVLCKGLADSEDKATTDSPYSCAEALPRADALYSGVRL